MFSVFEENLSALSSVPALSGGGVLCLTVILSDKL